MKVKEREGVCQGSCQAMSGAEAGGKMMIFDWSLKTTYVNIISALLIIYWSLEPSFITQLSIVENSDRFSCHSLVDIFRVETRN